MILIGGPLHGSEVELPEDAKQWVDLRRGHTYHCDRVTYLERDPITGRVTRLRKVPVLVFEAVRQIPSLQVRGVTVNQLVADVALRAWFDEHNDGIDYPIPSGLGEEGNGRRRP
jgi:hypothetical protein